MHAKYVSPTSNGSKVTAKVKVFLPCSSKVTVKLKNLVLTERSHQKEWIKSYHGKG